MSKPAKGGQGPPQGAPGGDFDSFWSASRTSRGPKKGVRKMDRKMDPQKIDFRRILRRVRADPGGVCGWHLGLKLTKSNSCLARLAPRRGRRIEDALRQATAAPVILAWLSLWVVGGLCVTCPCGRFVIRQGLGRSWQVLGRMAGAGESKNKYFLLSEYIERYGTGSQDPLMRCGLAKKWRPDQQNRGPRPAKRTPKAIKMRPCVFWKAFGARAAP